MPRPIMLSIAGDSGSGKTTITRGVVRVLGEDQVTHFCADDYHRYDRRQRAEKGITPLDPACNYIDVLTQDIRHLRHNEAILKPVYQHAGGTFGPPAYMKPARFVVAEGLLVNHAPELREMFDVRIYLSTTPTWSCRSCQAARKTRISLTRTSSCETRSRLPTCPESPATERPTT